MFPFNQRWAMSFWTVMFSRDVRFEPDTSRGLNGTGAHILPKRWLIAASAHAAKPGLRVDNRQKFAGAITAGWHAFNITSDKTTGVGAGAKKISRLPFARPCNRSRDRLGTDGRGVDQSTSQFAPEDTTRCDRLSAHVPAIASADLPSTHARRRRLHQRPAADRRCPRQTIFEGACVSCHGWTGESAISPFATLTGAGAVNDPPPQMSCRSSCPAPGGIRRRRRFRCLLSATAIRTSKSPKSRIM